MRALIGRDRDLIGHQPSSQGKSHPMPAQIFERALGIGAASGLASAGGLASAASAFLGLGAARLSWRTMRGIRSSRRIGELIESVRGGVDLIVMLAEGEECVSSSRNSSFQAPRPA
jgi:hypothetical protein